MSNDTTNTVEEARANLEAARKAALETAWARVQATATQVTDAQTAHEQSLQDIVTLLDGAKTFQIDGQFYQVRTREDKETHRVVRTLAVLKSDPATWGLGRKPTTV